MCHIKNITVIHATLLTPTKCGKYFETTPHTIAIEFVNKKQQW